MNEKMKFELPPNNRNVTDKELLDDLKKVAKELNKQTLTQREYTKSTKNRFYGGTLARRFGGWNKALEKAELEVLFISNISNEELIEDLKRVAKAIAPEKVTQAKYNERGKFSAVTFNERLGWNKALQIIGAEISVQQNITEEELFKNLEIVWIKLGRRPGRREMTKGISKYSEGPYRTKYGTWYKALEAFVEYINSDKDDIEEIENTLTEKNKSNTTQENEQGCKHKTKREPNDKLKLKVMWRDGNECKLCGLKLSVWEEGHFDHIKPWSKCGETTLKNLQILCAKCNLTKGNYAGE